MANGHEAREGLSNLANSIRRSTALYVAMRITDPQATEDEMLACADRLARWAAGTAGANEQAAASGERLLGKPFPG